MLRDPLPLWLSLLIALVAAPAAVILALSVVHAVLDRLLPRNAPVLRRVLRDGRGALRLAAALLAVLAVVPALDIPGNLSDFIRRAAGLTLIAALGWALTRKMAAIFDAYLERDQGGEDSLVARRRRTQLIVFRRLAVSAGVLLTAGLLLTAIPAVRTVGLSLFASAGVAGIVAGIAARPAVSNLIAGLQLALTQPIRIGDAVLVEGEWGHVTEITSTYVTILTWDQRSLVVPLGYLIERPIRNWTKNSAQLLDTVYVYLDYAVPVEAIRRKAREILDSTPLWDGRAWAVQVTDLKERCMEIRVLMSAANAGRMFDLRCLMREELVAFLARDYPQALPRARVALTGARTEPAAQTAK